MRARYELLAAFAVALLLTGGSPDAPPPVPSQAVPDPRVGKILDEWQRRAAGHKSLDVRFTRQDRSPAWNESPSYTGRLILMRDGRANLEFSAVDPDGKRSLHERMLWLGGAMHQLNYGEKQQFIWPIPEGDRGKLPALLALPFCWNATADGIKALYRVELVKETPKAWLLCFTPLKDVKAATFSKAYLQLNRETCLPDRYFLIAPNGKDTQDYSVTGIRRDEPIAEGGLSIPDGKGFSVVRVEEYKDTKLNAMILKLFPLLKLDVLP